MRVFKRGAGVAIALALALVLVSVPASGRQESREVSGQLETSRVARGRCNVSSTWRLSVRREGRRLLVTLVVRGGAANQEWNVFMDHNGRGFFAGSRVSGTDGVVSVRRTATNLPGIDRFRMGANNTVTLESCRGRVRT